MDGCSTGGMHDRRNAGKGDLEDEECMKELIQKRRDAGKGGMQE